MAKKKPTVEGATDTPATGVQETPAFAYIDRNLVTDAAVMYMDPDMLIADALLNQRAFGGTTDDQEFAELKQSVAQFGVLQPVLFNMEDEVPKLRIGFRRLEAIKQLRSEFPDNPRFTTIPAIPLNGGANALTLLRANLAENARRKGLSAIDKAHAMAQFAATGMTQQAIADEMGLRSKGQVSKMLTLLTLPVELQRQVHEGKLDAEAAYELSKKPAEVQEAASVSLAETSAEHAIDGSMEDAASTGTGGKKRKKRAAKKITRKAAKTARVAQSAKPGKKKALVTGDKTRSRDDVFMLFSALAKDKEVKEPVRLIAKAVIGVFDGRVSIAKFATVLKENTKGR